MVRPLADFQATMLKTDYCSDRQRTRKGSIRLQDPRTVAFLLGAPLVRTDDPRGLARRRVRECPAEPDDGGEGCRLVARRAYGVAAGGDLSDGGDRGVVYEGQGGKFDECWRRGGDGDAESW